jgi:Ca2+-binding RTX toxin-like protein
VLAAASLLAAGPSAAHAGVLEKVGSTYVYTSSDFETDNMVLFRDDKGAGPADDELQFFNSPSTIDITQAPGCSRFSPDPFPTRNAKCLASGITGLEFELRNRDDFWKSLSDMGVAVIVHAGQGNDFLDSRDGGEALLGEAGEDEIDDGSSDLGDDFIEGGPGNDLIHDGPGKDDISGGDGIDTVDAFATISSPQSITLDDVSDDGEAGEQDNYRSDVENVTGGRGEDHIVGSGEANALDGGNGHDTLEGGAGADVLIGGAGPDELLGGDDFYRASYPARASTSDSEDQTITIDDVADDGAAGEGDNVHTDVEDVSAGPGDDHVTGSAAANTIDGGDGADTITGGAGVDTLFGGPGPDHLDSRDGLPERVDCGPDGAGAVVDTNDTVLACPIVDASNVLIPDVDGDGSDKPPGPDCDDGNAAIHPGAQEVPNNEIDENCDGARAFDRDGDGHLALPLGPDCADLDPAVHPGVPEVRGNGVDEDCSGVADPFRKLAVRIGAEFFVFPSFTRITLLRLRALEGGETVRVTCRGRGCPLRRKRIRVGPSREQVNLSRRFRGANLRPGVLLKVRVSKQDAITRIVRLKIRDRRSPKRSDLCLAPTASKPVAC